VRGGAARGISAGGAVFRVRRVGDIALLVVQWALVVFGLYLLIVAAHLTVMGMLSDDGLPVGDYFIVPIFQRLAQALVHGFGALGLAALLFYLRRIHLSRHQ
jgi:hypothetical protein